MSSVQWRERGYVCEQQNQRLDKESAIVCVCVWGWGMGGVCVCVGGCLFAIAYNYSNQSFYRLTASYWMGGGA